MREGWKLPDAQGERLRGWPLARQGAVLLLALLLTGWLAVLTGRIMFQESRGVDSGARDSGGAATGEATKRH